MEIQLPTWPNETEGTLFQRQLDFMDYTDPALNVGNPNPEITTYVLDSAGSELGFFAFAILICIFFLLNQVDGKPFRLKIFLMNRDFSLLKSEFLVKFVNFNLSFVTWLSYLLPFLSLSVWAAGLIIRANDFGTSPVGGISVILVGCSFMLFTYGILRIKWNNYQIGVLSGVCFLLAFSCLTAYQYLVIELDISSRSFFGYSTVFLNSNLVILTVAVFINSGIVGGSIADVINNKLQKGEELDANRETDFLEEIDEQRSNKAFQPKYYDIIDLFTVGSAGDDELLKGAAFGGGLQTRFRLLSQRTKRLITFFLWCCATGVLVIYSYVIWWEFDYSRLGFLNMIATLITDVFIYFIWSSKITHNNTLLVATGLINRLSLFVFGDNYWIYGYIVLYLIYGVVLSVIIAENRFPFENAYNEIDLDDISHKSTSFDVSRAPEFLLLFITISYVILFAVLYVAQPIGVPLLRLDLDGFSHPYYIVGVFALLLIVTFFALISTYRLFMRKKKFIQPQIHFYFKNQKLDLYWMFIGITFILLAAVGLISSWITEVISTFIVIIFVSIFIILYLNVLLHYMMNDYNFLQSIEAQNVKIRKHNQRITDLKVKVISIKKDIQQGNTAAIGAANADLAKSIMDKNKLKKQEQKTQNQIKGASNDPQAMNLSKYGGWSVSATPKKDFNLSQRVNPYNQADVNILVPPSPSKQPTGSISKVQPLAPSQLPSSMRSGEEDKLIQEELDKVGRGNEEMYEGGEEEKTSTSQNQSAQNTPYGSNQQNQGIEVIAEVDGEGGDNEAHHDHEDGDNDSSDEEVDFDAADDDQDQKKQKRLIKEITDWRTEMNWFMAYIRGRLRPNDYQIINSLLIAHAAIILMAALTSYVDASDLGVQIGVPLVHYFTAGFVLQKTISTDTPMVTSQYLLFALAYVIQYGWSVASIYINYTVEDLNPNLSEQTGAGTYMIVYLMVIPFITSALSAAAKLYDDKGKSSGFSIFMIILSGLQVIGMIALAFIYTTYVQGIIIVVVFIGVAYSISQILIYVNHDFYLPRLWTIINAVIVSLIVIACTVVSLFSDEYRTYTGVSISVWVLCFFMLVYGFSELYTDLSKIETNPIFFAPCIFPIYIYNPKKNDVVPKYGPTIVIFAALVFLILWSVTCTVWVYPHNIGISVGILVEQVLIILSFHLIGVSSYHLHELTKQIDKKILRRAFLDAKHSYVTSRQAINREQLLTYEKITYQRDNFRNQMRMKEGRNSLNFEERSEGVKFIPNDQIDVQWVDDTKVDINDTNSIYAYSYLFTLEKEQNRIYREELEFIIQYQLLIVANAESFEQQKKKYLFTFLQEKKAALFALGIVINIPDTGTTIIRYARVITQLQKLTPEKQTIFNKLREQFIQDQREQDEKRKEAALIEEEKQQERLAMLSQLSGEKKKLLESVNMDMAVDDMPDCEMKFEKIKAEAANGKIFVDNKFKANDDSLGQNCLNRGVTQWVRARENKPNTRLYQDKVNCLDVTQGALGDCYFLSAISVLGERFVRRVIISTEEDWKLTGAFCIKFFKDGDPEIVIVDDFFPALGNKEWCFVKGGAGDELWPMVLEKAYAKMYGNYNYIEAGKVHSALSDMTDGFPEQMDLKMEGKNIQKLWEILKGLKRHGALMGAGSPENTLGDKAINEMGIVQGHAYAVLDVQEIDGHKLMQVRNPHGSTGVEWNGDWSDGSDKWNERMKNKVGYTESNDGAFWMDVIDFVQQYSYLYICRILDKEDGWVEHNQQDAWKGGSAEGLPSRTNPNARLDFNPQYSITINKPCEGFICLRQFDKENMFKGKHNIFFMVSKLNGKRITKVDKATMLMRSGNPTNLNIVTAECDFDKSVSYPYKFTMMVANLEHQKEGEGKFEFSIYSTDSKMKVETLPFPIDFPKDGGQSKIE